MKCDCDCCRGHSGWEPLRLWTGCELFMPMLIRKEEDYKFVVKCPTHGDSISLPHGVGVSLSAIIDDIERGDSFRAWQVMGWAICTRRNRWTKAAEARRKEDCR